MGRSVRYAELVRPIVRIALGSAALLVLNHLAELRLRPGQTAQAATSLAPAGSAAPPCPAGALPDHGACIPVPDEDVAEAGPLPEVEANEHHERSGRLVRYEHIPRRPDRPEDYRLYALPIAVRPHQAVIGSGYDLDLPDAQQRRGFALKAVGHGGIDLAAPRGTEVHVVRLEHQVGEAEVLFIGELFGTTVITRHTVREAGDDHDYLVLHGHLERAPAGLRAGDAVRTGTVIGYVGDTGSAGIVHLHLEVRRVRDGVHVRELGARELVHNARTIACDPRNVLELTSADAGIKP